MDKNLKALLAELKANPSCGGVIRQCRCAAMNKIEKREGLCATCTTASQTFALVEPDEDAAVQFLRYLLACSEHKTFDLKAHVPRIQRILGISTLRPPPPLPVLLKHEFTGDQGQCGHCGESQSRASYGKPCPKRNPE